jgi:hypothetical protein
LFEPVEELFGGYCRSGRLVLTLFDTVFEGVSEFVAEVGLSVPTAIKVGVGMFIVWGTYVS